MEFLKKWALKIFYKTKRNILFPVLRYLKRIFSSSFSVGVIILFIALIVFFVFNSLVFSARPSLDLITILAAVHGFFGDVIIFSLISVGLMLIFNHHRKTQDLREKLDDFSAWNSEEAFFRKAGIIKALSRRHSPVLQVKGMILKDAQLKNANFEGAVIEDSSFEGCNLDYSNFQRTKINLEKANQRLFNEASLNFCRFNEARINGVDFSNLEMEGVDFAKADLNNVFFQGCNLQHSCFKEISLDSPDFTRANLYRANMSYSKMIAVSFSIGEKRRFKNSRSARLHHVDFQFSQLDKGCFCQCDVSFSSFFSASLKDADFCSADLSHSDFRSACLANADFTDADLNQAHLEGADLSGANLKYARNLEIWQLEKVKTLYQASLEDSHILNIKQMGLSHLLEYPRPS